MQIYIGPKHFTKQSRLNINTYMCHIPRQYMFIEKSDWRSCLLSKKLLFFGFDFAAINTTAACFLLFFLRRPTLCSSKNNLFLRTIFRALKARKIICPHFQATSAIFTPNTISLLQCWIALSILSLVYMIAQKRQFLLLPRHIQT